MANRRRWRGRSGRRGYVRTVVVHIYRGVALAGSGGLGGAMPVLTAAAAMMANEGDGEAGEGRRGSGEFGQPWMSSAAGN